MGRGVIIRGGIAGVLCPSFGTLAVRLGPTGRSAINRDRKPHRACRAVLCRTVEVRVLRQL
jgi:hypothetical protein